VDLLFDPGTFTEDGQLANALADGLPADGVVTGRGLVQGRPALVVANDPSVKAGSWGARTVEKMIRMTEVALADELPIFWFIDSAGARITDQVDLFPGRRGAGRIFRNQVALSGRCRRSAACSGRAPRAGRTFPRSATSSSWSRPTLRCTSVRRGWPRWWWERRSPWRRWAGRGCTPRSPGVVTNWPPTTPRRRPGQAVLLVPAAELAVHSADLRRPDPAGSSAPIWCRRLETAGYDIHTVIEALVDDGSFFEVKPLFAPNW
jgi:hypothetical protein